MKKTIIMAALLAAISAFASYAGLNPVLQNSATTNQIPVAQLPPAATNVSLTYPSISGENIYAEIRNSSSMLQFTNWQGSGSDYVYGGNFWVAANVVLGIWDNGHAFVSGEQFTWTNYSGLKYTVLSTTTPSTPITNWGIYNGTGISGGVTETLIGSQPGYSIYGTYLTQTNPAYYYIEQLTGQGFNVQNELYQWGNLYAFWGYDTNNNFDLMLQGQNRFQFLSNGTLALSDTNGNNVIQVSRAGTSFGNGAGGMSGTSVATNGTIAVVASTSQLNLVSAIGGNASFVEFLGQDTNPVATGGYVWAKDTASLNGGVPYNGYSDLFQNNSAYNYATAGTIDASNDAGVEILETNKNVPATLWLHNGDTNSGSSIKIAQNTAAGWVTGYVFTATSPTAATNQFTGIMNGNGGGLTNLNTCTVTTSGAQGTFAGGTLYYFSGNGSINFSTTPSAITNQAITIARPITVNSISLSVGTIIASSTNDWCVLCTNGFPSGISNTISGFDSGYSNCPAITLPAGCRISFEYMTSASLPASTTVTIGLFGQ